MFERLYDIREENNLTQEQVAEILKVDRSAISRWETNIEIIPLEKLNMFANYFNINFDYLSGLSTKRNTNILKNNLDPNYIGSKLVEFRKENHMTQIELADELNTTQSTISAYESGKTLILTSFAYEIAIKHNISLDWLCGKVK